MRLKREFAYTSLGCVLLLSGVVLMINVQAQAPKQAQIVFYSNRDGADLSKRADWEIYVMDVDGNNQRRSTNNPSSNKNPSWSPDGQRIAFMSRRDGNWEIYVMDVDGNNQRNLTNSPEAVDAVPQWSPDGQKIAFTSTFTRPKSKLAARPFQLWCGCTAAPTYGGGRINMADHNWPSTRTSSWSPCNIASVP